MNHGSRCFLVMIGLLLAFGCSGPRRQLHSLSGDAFTLYPLERQTPPEITCTGEPSDRFACFADEIGDRATEEEASGALVVLAPARPHVMTFTAPGARPSIDPATRFPVASMTKMFVGATAAALAEASLVDLHRPIASYVPELRNDVGPGRATLHQLLTHTSGVPTVSPCEEGDDIDDLVIAFGKRPLWAPPGAVYSYSNLGYTYVAAVLERVTGKPFEAVVAEQVLGPVGIPGATFDPKAVVVSGQPPPELSPSRRCRGMRPSGGLALNVEELSYWIHAVSRPEVSPLGRAVVEKITAPYVQTGLRPGETYGYGVSRFDVGGVQVYAHAGMMSDYSSFVAWVPTHHAGAGAFANTYGSLPASAVARGLSTFLGLPVDWNGPEGPAHSLGAYAGTYDDTAGGLGRVRVSVEGDHLAVDYLGGAPPERPVTFRFYFDDQAPRARWLVTEVGIGERRDAEGEGRSRPQPG